MDKRPLLDSTSDEPIAGSSELNAPAYQESNVVDKTHFLKEDPFVPPGGEEPPPEFTPYEAEHFTGSYGEIISHDPHLNQDGKLIENMS